MDRGEPGAPRDTHKYALEGVLGTNGHFINFMGTTGKNVHMWTLSLEEPFSMGNSATNTIFGMWDADTHHFPMIGW
jgi:hypothetical protein